MQSCSYYLHKFIGVGMEGYSDEEEEKSLHREDSLMSVYDISTNASLEDISVSGSCRERGCRLKLFPVPFQFSCRATLGSRGQICDKVEKGLFYSFLLKYS